MEAFLQNLLSSNDCTLEESQVFGQAGADFWHSTVLTADRSPMGGGFAATRMNARKIAIAEYLERKSFLEFSKGNIETQKKWGLDLVPTGCGFAAGFNRDNTVRRSILEGVERWTMSQWIDEQCSIVEIPVSKILQTIDPISKFFIAQFDHVRFFEKSLLLDINGQLVGIKFGFTVGLTQKGAYPGSSVQLSEEAPWQHALLESFRHLLIVKNGPRSLATYPFNKIFFFSENKISALEQIQRAKKPFAPLPKISFHHSESFLSENYFIARTIFPGWQSWNEGPLERFLY